MTTEQPKGKSNSILVKEYFSLTTKEAIEVKKNMPAEALEQLGEGIRNGSMTY